MKIKVCKPVLLGSPNIYIWSILDRSLYNHPVSLSALICQVHTFFIQTSVSCGPSVPEQIWSEVGNNDLEISTSNSQHNSRKSRETVQETKGLWDAAQHFIIQSQHDNCEIYHCRTVFIFWPLSKHRPSTAAPWQITSSCAADQLCCQATNRLASFTWKRQLRLNTVTLIQWSVKLHVKHKTYVQSAFVGKWGLLSLFGFIVVSQHEMCLYVCVLEKAMFGDTGSVVWSLWLHQWPMIYMNVTAVTSNLCRVERDLLGLLLGLLC